MMVFWMINFCVGTVVVILFPGAWLAIGVYYVFALSIYANWDTDYDAVSASLAAEHGASLLALQSQKEPEDDQVVLSYTPLGPPGGPIVPGIVTLADLPGSGADTTVDAGVSRHGCERCGRDAAHKSGGDR